MPTDHVNGVNNGKKGARGEKISHQTSTVPVISGWAPILGTNLSYCWSQSISTGVGVTYIPSSSKLEGGIDGDVNLAVHF